MAFRCRCGVWVWRDVFRRYGCVGVMGTRESGGGEACVSETSVGRGGGWAGGQLVPGDKPGEVGNVGEMGKVGK